MEGWGKQNKDQVHVPLYCLHKQYFPASAGPPPQKYYSIC